MKAAHLQAATAFFSYCCAVLRACALNAFSESGGWTSSWAWHWCKEKSDCREDIQQRNMCLRSIANALSRHLRLKLGCYRGDKTEFGHVDYTYTYFEGFVSSAFWFLCIMTKHRTRGMQKKDCIPKLASFLCSSWVKLPSVLRKLKGRNANTTRG